MVGTLDKNVRIENTMCGNAFLNYFEIFSGSSIEVLSHHVIASLRTRLGELGE